MEENLKKIDDFLLATNSQLNLLNLITPTNIQIEKERFFASSDYNPLFEYSIELKQIQKIEKSLKDLVIYAGSWQGVLLNEVREKLLNDVALIQEIGGDVEKFEMFNRKKYVSCSDLSDQDVLKVIDEEIDFISEEIQKRNLFVKDVKIAFEDFLKEKNIKWTVRIDENLVSLLSVDYFNEEIKINPLIQLTNNELQRMLIHEVETHIYRFLNGKNLFKMASVGLKSYEKAEEGLAVFNESLVFPEDKTIMKRLYIRYMAVVFGEKNSFRKLYKFLQEELFLDSEESWRTAVRVKRGITDTSLPGAFLKDKVYLEGYFAVSKLSLAQKKYLYKGKFSLEHLRSKQFNLDDDNLIISPQYLPSIYANLK